MRAATVGVLLGVIGGGIIVGHDRESHAQITPDLERAKDLYRTAEAQMAAGQFGDASATYGAVYELTRDPVLFYKIGSANEKAGKCDVAVIYYGRYLREAKPAEKFVSLTRERITACGGDPSTPVATDPVVEPPAAGSAAGSADGVAGPAGPGSASGSGTVAAEVPVAEAPVPVEQRPVGQHKTAWLLVGGSIAFATIGAVLAYSASAAENDVADLYIGLGDRPPVFDARTQSTYEALLADGRRYEVLSWTSFGLAGAAAIGAAIVFLHDSDAEHTDRSVRVTPTVGRDGGGVAATVRF